MSEFLTVEQAAPILQMKPQGVWRAIREKQFPFQVIRIGKQIRIPKSALESAIAASSDAAKK